MVVRQGEVYWVPLRLPVGSEPGHARPCLVLQSNRANRSRIATVIVCALTSNTRRAGAPGNVLLKAGEAGLGMPSVANVSQVFTVDKTWLGNSLGRLSRERIVQVLEGLYGFLEPSLD